MAVFTRLDIVHLGFRSCLVFTNLKDIFNLFTRSMSNSRDDMM